MENISKRFILGFNMIPLTTYFQRVIKTTNIADGRVYILDDRIAGLSKADMPQAFDVKGVKPNILLMEETVLPSRQATNLVTYFTLWMYRLTNNERMTILNRLLNSYGENNIHTVELINMVANLVDEKLNASMSILRIRVEHLCQELL